MLASGGRLRLRPDPGPLALRQPLLSCLVCDADDVTPSESVSAGGGAVGKLLCWPLLLSLLTL